MHTQRYTAFFAGFSMLFLVASCGPKTTNLTPTATEKTVESAPEWYLDVPSDPSYLYAAETATSKDMGLAVKKAATTGRAELARQLETKMSSLEKDFQEEVGSEEDSELLQQFSTVIKGVTSQTLNGSRQDKRDVQPEKGIYRAYVLMSLPIGEANMALMEKIKANKNIYTRYRATQAFEELDAAIKAHEAQQGSVGQ